jgi:ComF family protein
MMPLIYARAALSRVVDLLLPASCAFCGVAASEELICQGCLDDLPWVAHACERCGTPVATPLPPGVSCGSCQQRPPPFDTTFAPLHYDFPVDAAIKALKFERRLHLAPALASLMLPVLAPELDRFDALVPVPLYRWRRARRGYNQAHELAKFLRVTTGLPISQRVLRTRNTEPQSGLDAATRRRNMKGVFQLHHPPECARPLIIDDVMTTGETCRALASVLIAGGAERVGVLTIAHASMRTTR